MANTTKNYTDDERDELRRQVWSLWCRGVKNKTAIARKLNLSHPTVRSYIEYMKAQTTERIARGDEMAEVLSGYQETIDAAWSLSATTKNDNAKIGAIRVVQDGLKAIAGMFGVSTAKQVVEQSGNVGVSVTGAELLAKCGGDDDTAELLKQLSAKVASSPLDAGDADARTE